jgi:hypothetical protein
MMVNHGPMGTSKSIGFTGGSIGSSRVVLQALGKTWQDKMDELMVSWFTMAVFLCG